MLTLVLVGLAAAAAALAGTDRLLAALAGRLAGRRLSVWLGPGTAADVRINGWPFLPQLSAGRYREIEIGVGSLAAGGVELRDLRGRLSGVQAPLRPVLAGHGVTATGLTATATVPLTSIAGRLPPGLVVRRQGGELRVSGMVVLMPVSGTLALRPDGQRIAVVPKVLGMPSLLGFVIPLPGLPPGLTIDSLRLGDGGVELTLRGENIRLGPE